MKGQYWNIAINLNVFIIALMAVFFLFLYFQEGWHESRWQKAYYIIITTLTYIWPLAVIAVAYALVCRRLWAGIPSDETSHDKPEDCASGSRDVNSNSRAQNGRVNKTMETQLDSRRKVARMLIVVVIIYAVCYFPIRLLNLLR